MQLQQLLPEQVIPQAINSRGLLTGLTIDSREVKPGMAFLACRGEQVNGADYIDQALAKGAAAVLIDASQSLADPTVSIVAVERLEQRLGELADRFYGQPSQMLNVVGITGTNGKTSTSHFLAQALNSLGHPAAVMGTVGYGLLNQLQAASHTTPDVVRVHQMMAEMKAAGAEQLLMEVSSHALDQHRVDRVNFDQAVFTNLTRDHLDYHGDMQAYGDAKARLFSDYGIRQAVLNLDDPFVGQLLDRIPAGVHISGFGLAPSEQARRLSENMICMERYHLTTEGIWGEMSTPKGRLPFKSSVIGRFNLSNLMATVAVLQGQGFENEQIAHALHAINGVAGRMETVADDSGRLVVIDYAHTPDALDKALATLREHVQGQLWCVFGCGGNRDKGKRPLMAAAAEKRADSIVVTSDNPRSESADAIINDVVAGFSRNAVVRTIVDRAEAIRYVLQQADAGDVVLVAGKGHEDYQEVDGVRHHFSDRETIAACLEGAA